jgi:hypothetical protein
LPTCLDGRFGAFVADTLSDTLRDSLNWKSADAAYSRCGKSIAAVTAKEFIWKAATRLLRRRKWDVRPVPCVAVLDFVPTRGSNEWYVVEVADRA